MLIDIIFVKIVLDAFSRIKQHSGTHHKIIKL